MSIDPRIWGPHAWFLMYSVAMTYPHCPKEEDKKNARVFYESLGRVLPCVACRNNFKKHISLYPLSKDALKDRVSLIKWLINVNNEVKKITKSPLITYEDTVDKYTDIFHGRQVMNNTRQRSYILYTGIVLICIVFLIVMRKQIRNSLSRVLDRRN